MEKIANIKFELDFDKLSKSMSITEYTQHLMDLLDSLLKNRFPDSPIKQITQKRIDRISISCPYCGDSMQSDYKKRGNIILKGKYAGYYKCHNCSIFTSIDRFFKDFKIELKLDAINYMVDNLGDFTTYTNAKYDMSLLLDMENLDKYALDREEFKNKFNLIEVENSSIWLWLKNRLQFQREKFLYNPDLNYVMILNLTQSGKILGAQKRLFKGFNRFESYKLSKIYEIFNKPLEVNEKQLDYLDTLSLIFNICLLNFNKPIQLLEGPMDAFLIPNSIANTGANKELPIDLNVRFLYDSDETGVKKSIEHINLNNEVFLWQKYLKDLNAPYRKKWDVNDIFIWCKKNNKKIPSFSLYFSNDPLDIIDI